MLVNNFTNRHSSITPNLLTFITFFAISIFLLSSCQKDDDLQELAQIEQEELAKTTSPAETSALSSLTTTQDETDNTPNFINFAAKDTTMVEIGKATTKSGRERIYSNDISLSGGYYTYVYINKHSLDPNCKYIAKITRYAGDPDLYIYAGNGTNATDRKIRRAEATGGGNEEAEATYADLRSHEGRIFFIVYADQHQQARCKLEIFKDCDNHNECHNLPTNCEQVTCTSRFPSDGDIIDGAYRPYRSFIEASFASNYEISHWEVNGERRNTTENDPTFMVYQPGDYTVCCYFWCDGQLYKCCTVVTCPPHENCCDDDILHQPWLQPFTDCSNFSCPGKIYCATYDGRPVILMTPSNICADGGSSIYDCEGTRLHWWGYFGSNPSDTPTGNLIQGRLLWNPTTDCYNNGHCSTLQTENFSSYSNGDYIGLASHRWATWDHGREGTAQDARVAGSYSSQRHLQLNALDDVVYKLGNRSNGKYELTFNLNVSGTAHFNIQNTEQSRVSGGVFGVSFSSNGTFRVRTNTNGQSSSYNFPRNQSINIKVKLDFDRREHQVIVAGRTINVVSAQNFHALGAINFYAPQNGDFTVDNIELKQCN